MREFTKVALEAAEKAGRMLKENQDKAMELEFKGEIDIVTPMDKKSEKIIIEHISGHFPSHSIIAEEGTGDERSNKYIWYIDPLDGTVNYAHHIPWYAISIGLFVDDEPVAGVIHNPATGDMFYGENGEGAYFNGKRMKVTDRKEMIKSILCSGFPYYVSHAADRIVNNLKSLLVKSQGVRRFGAAALDLAFVAAGKYDGYWEEGLKPWDTAAGILLVTEAGGKVTDYWNKKFNIFGKTIVASNGLIHDEMIETLETTGLERD
jgi:myo-inositol-1(or 4)-monophosphatase